jgi:hypothetical protein
MRTEYNLSTGKTTELDDFPVMPPTNDQIKKSIKQEIITLEQTVTPRNYREFVLGNQNSIDKINSIESQIEALRGQL